MNQSALRIIDRITLAAGVLFLIFGGWYVQTHHINPAEAQAPAEKKLRVLIVPGHEPGFGGTSYRGIYERDLAVTLAQDLKQELVRDGRFEVYTTRDTQSWNPVFSSYFKKNWAAIARWETAAWKKFRALVASGKVKKPVSIVAHNKAPENVALRLYGISKWANEHDIDVVVHIHLNDDDNHRYNRPGKFRGFAIYVPVMQYGNGKASHEAAKDVVVHLAKDTEISNFKGESGGIVDEPKLIAVGANDTLNAASLVIEYGYIYEPKFVDPRIRGRALYNMAEATYQGLNDYRQEKIKAGE